MSVTAPGYAYVWIGCKGNKIKCWANKRRYSFWKLSIAEIKTIDTMCQNVYGLRTENGHGDAILCGITPYTIEFINNRVTN